jgi:hypothetical protein
MNELEELAKIHVGNAASDYTFVTVCGKVTAVFIGNELAARQFAEAFKDVPAVVENRDGIIFDNAISLAQQRACDEF